MNTDETKNTEKPRTAGVQVEPIVRFVTTKDYINEKA